MDITMPDCFHDETIVSLNEDELAVANNSISTIFSALDLLYTDINNEKLKVSMRHAITGSVKNHLERIIKALRCNEDDESVKKNDHNIIRSLNEEIIKLKSDLKESCPLDGIESRLISLNQKVSAWWNSYGFSFLNSSFKAYYNSVSYEAELTCTLDVHSSFCSETPVTDVQKKKNVVQDLMDRGLELYSDHGDYIVIDNDNNRKWLTNELKSKLPSAEIFKTDNYKIRKSEHYWLRHIHIRTCNFKEIDQNIV